jgi:hypothetical protein
VIDAAERSGRNIYLLEHEEYGDEVPCVIVNGEGRIILEDVYNGFDDYDEAFCAETKDNADSSPFLPADEFGGRVTLLTADEAVRYKYEGVLRGMMAAEEWWLRSPGKYEYNAAFVDTDGLVSVYGNYVDNEFLAIRPALNLSFGVFENVPAPGEKFAFAGENWTALEHRGGEGVFCIAADTVEQRRYDRKSNVWESSEVREYLNEECLQKLTEAWRQEREQGKGTEQETEPAATPRRK